MGDNIRNKAIFEIKMQKLLKNNWSLSFIVTAKWPGQNTILKSGFFCQQFQPFLAKLNFNFLLHNFNSYVIYDIFQIFCMKGSGRYGSDKESVTDKRTDRRTDGHTRREKQYMSPPAGDIYYNI